MPAVNFGLPCINGVIRKTAKGERQLDATLREILREMRGLSPTSPEHATACDCLFTRGFA